MLEYSVVILAGGKSSRMGEDKALIPFVGETTLIEFILQQIKGLGYEQLIIANNPDSYLHFGLPVFVDTISGVGALGGVYSGIFQAACEYCLILACDMPFIKRSLLEYMVMLAPDFDAVVPRLNPPEFSEPFRAVYSKVCLPKILRAINDGKRKAASFFGDVNIRYLEDSEISRYDPTGLTFFNVNTPKDLVEAGRLVKGNKLE